MCFSAPASFIASAVLATTGVIAIKKTPSSSSKAFACIPVLFAIQQFAEGFVWLSIKNPDFASFYKVSSYTFLFFALVIWPFFVPLSIMLMEKIKNRRKIMMYLFIFGLVFSIFELYTLIFCNISIKETSYHIYYAIDFPIVIPILGGIVYFTPTVIPTLISSVKGMRIFGILIFISFIITHIFFKENVISIWCFFAAILSSIIYYIVVNVKSDNSITNETLTVS